MLLTLAGVPVALVADNLQTPTLVARVADHVAEVWLQIINVLLVTTIIFGIKAILRVAKEEQPELIQQVTGGY